MITLKEYQIIERYNIDKGIGSFDKYSYDYSIYSVKSYKLFGIIMLFKNKKLIKNSNATSYNKPKRKERY